MWSTIAKRMQKDRHAAVFRNLIRCFDWAAVSAAFFASGAPCKKASELGGTSGPLATGAIL
jgi:hypothetical protein